MSKVWCNREVAAQRQVSKRANEIAPKLPVLTFEFTSHLHFSLYRYRDV